MANSANVDGGLAAGGSDRSLGRHAIVLTPAPGQIHTLATLTTWRLHDVLTTQEVAKADPHLYLPHRPLLQHPPL